MENPSRYYKVVDAGKKIPAVDTSGKGTGLGLSICKQIMEMHRQSIEVLPLESGAAFRFTLQLSRKQEPQKLQSR